MLFCKLAGRGCLSGLNKDLHVKLSRQIHVSYTLAKVYRLFKLV